MNAYGSQSMAAPLRRVLMRSAANAMRRADRPNGTTGRVSMPPGRPASMRRLPNWSRRPGAAIDWIDDREDGLSDSVFTHDPSLMSDHGAIILSMGKALRHAEPALHEETYKRLGVPVLGRIEAPGQVEGGDCVWVDARTLAIGRGVRTNQAGIQQMADLLGRTASTSSATTCRSGTARKPACI